MRHDFYLAWRYLYHHRVRSLILVICLSLMGAMPLGVHEVMNQGKRAMLERAVQTPLIAGRLGSSVDLTLNALYFNNPEAQRTTMAEVDRIERTGWALALPVYSRFSVRGHPLVGVTLDYLDYRRLTAARGEMMTTLGDCVLGAEVAEALGLGPGDTLLTTPGSLFDLAGIYPLKLHVTGVLGKRNNPDDGAIFIDLKTAWIIEGLGHGHEATVKPVTATPPESGDNQIADPGLVTYTEITPENLESFHFHGDPATYPISAVIAVPNNHRDETLLRGRYLSYEKDAQLVAPLGISENLLDNIFRIRELFDGVLVMVGLSTLLALSLVFSLSLRMRRGEMRTLFLLGSSRFTMFRLLTAESLMLAFASLGLGGLLIWMTRHWLSGLMLRLVIE
jgi:putative ABC transport system permease protein